MNLCLMERSTNWVLGVETSHKTSFSLHISDLLINVNILESQYFCWILASSDINSFYLKLLGIYRKKDKKNILEMKYHHVSTEAAFAT